MSPNHGTTPIVGLVVAGVMVLGLLAGAGMAGAQSAMPPAGPAHDHRLLTPEDRAAIGEIFWQRVKERLGLTDDQARDLRATLAAQRQAMRSDLRSLREARAELRDLLAAPASDAGAIDAAAARLKSLQAKLVDLRIQNRLAVRAKLSPEQLEKWLQLRKDMRHHGRRPGRGFGAGTSY
jgi:Spy/CpxP family protein refolding chaperone